MNKQEVEPDTLNGGRTGDSNESPQPDKWRIYDIQQHPEKDFWIEINKESELRKKKNVSFPDSIWDARKNDRYEVKPLFSAETILQRMSEIASENWGGKQEATKHDWKNAWQTLCEDLEVFQSSEKF